MPSLPELPGVRHAEHALPTRVTLHVAEAADPAAPALLAPHGWPQHWWVWREVLPALAETHRVICPDLRGLGWSGQPADGDFAYQYPLAAPVLGPALIRDGRLVRLGLHAAMDDADADVFADVLREPARATASSLFYRHFHTRDLPAPAAGRCAHTRVELPVKLLFPRGDQAQHRSQLGGLEEHAPQAEVELVDGGHLLVDEQPELVIDPALAWFA
jgi:pimeloyl-ACP methyl ester carboxylesterase